MANIARSIRLKKNYILAVFAILLFLSFVFVNIGSGLLFGRKKADFTGDARYTLSESSRQIVSEINTPVYIRLYLSSAVSREYPALYQYSQTVLRRLETYRNQNPEMIQIEVKDPEPYGKIAEEAKAQGLKSFLSTDGQFELYFGAVFGNDNGDSRIIEQFSPGRAGYLENDISRTIAGLNNPLRTKIGILNGNLPISEKTYGQNKGNEWAFLKLLQNEYDVVPISSRMVEIPYDVETLLLISPANIPPLFAYALDQYLLRGGRVILFADPYSEIEAEIYGTASVNSGNINKTLKNWGASVDFNKVIGDPDISENIVATTDKGQRLQNRPTWLNLNKQHINQDLVFSKNIASVRLKSPGSIELQTKEHIKSTPLFSTTQNGDSIDTETLKLFGDQNFADEHRQYVIAALIEGTADSSYLHNPLDGTGFEEEMLPFLPTSIKEGKLLIIADSDILADSLWINKQISGDGGVYEQIPYTQNGELILRAVDYMTGAGNIAGLGSKQLSPELNSISREIYQRRLEPYLPEYERVKKLLEEKEKFVKTWNEVIQNNEAKLNMSVVKKLEQTRRDIEKIKEKQKQIEYRVRKETTAEIDAVIWINMAGIPALILFAVWIFCFIRTKRRSRKVREVINEYKIS